jgi:hypothetical protein
MNDESRAQGAASESPSEATTSIFAHLTDKLLAGALGYAALGWPVFPCRPDRKDPLTLHGKDDATTDPATVRAWWERWPSANVAIRTGAPAVDVLDVDVRTEGNGWPPFGRLVRAGLLTGAIRLVRTRSGGLHVYFPGTEQGCRKLTGLFIDFKARGGYVLAPPSRVDGKPYELLEERPGGRVLDFGKVERLLAPPRPASRLHVADSNGKGIAALARWLQGQREGNRNEGLFWAAKKAVKDGCSDDDLAGLVAIAVDLGLSRIEAERTVHSARRRAAVSA